MNTYSNMVKLTGQRGRYEPVLTRAKQKEGLSEGPAPAAKDPPEKKGGLPNSEGNRAVLTEIKPSGIKRAAWQEVGAEKPVISPKYDTEGKARNVIHEGLEDSSGAGTGKSDIAPMSKRMGLASFGKMMMQNTPADILTGKVNPAFLSSGEISLAHRKAVEAAEKAKADYTQLKLDWMELSQFGTTEQQRQEWYPKLNAAEKAKEEAEAKVGMLAQQYYRTSGREISRRMPEDLLKSAVELAVQIQKNEDKYRYGGSIGPDYSYLFGGQSQSGISMTAYEQLEKAKEQLVAAGYSREDVDRAVEYQVYAARELAAQEEMQKLQERLTETEERYTYQGNYGPDYSWLFGGESQSGVVKEEKPKHSGFTESVNSILMAPVQGLDFLNMRVATSGRNNPADVYGYKPASVADLPATLYANTVTKAVTERIRGEEPTLLGNAAAFLYQVGMSTAQSTALAAALGPGSLAVMGGAAAANAALDVIERGGTNNQAFASGIAAGFAEVLFEKFSVDNLLKGVRDSTFFKSLLKQGGIEASEEMATEVANILSDAAIMGQSSRFHEAVRAYMELGQVSEEEAEKKAFLDCVADVGLAGLGGFLSGGSSMAMIGGSQLAADRLLGNKNAASGEAEKPRIKMEDFANVNSPVWNNVAYEDVGTQQAIMQEAHQEMVAAGEVVSIPEETLEKTAQSFPDLRGVKKKERTPILRQRINELKESLRQFLNGMKGSKYEFDVNGSILEARLYNTGIEEVMEKITQSKASMLYHSEDVFRKSRYLYSTPDYDGDPNIYRWNYFYVPVQIGEELAGVRIAIRDMAATKESQIYNWGIKKDAVLDGGGRGQSRISSGVSSTASFNNNIPLNRSEVNESHSEEDPFLQGFNEGESEETGLDTAVEGWEDDPFLQGFYEEDVRELGGRSNSSSVANGGVNARSGLIQNVFSARLDRGTARILDLLGKATGTSIVVEDRVRGGTANGSYQNGVVRIAADAANPALVVGKHEITHRMQELAPEEYKVYRDYAVRVLSAERNGLVERYQRSAAEQGEILTREQALDEIAADFTEVLLTDETRLEQFLTEAATQTESRNMVQKFFDAVREFLVKVRSVFNGERAKMDAATREQFGVSLRQLERAEQRWMELVQASGESDNKFVHLQDVRDTMYSRKNVQTKFQRKFTGEVISDEYIELSNAEKAAVSHALKTGYGQIDLNGYNGCVNIGRYCYVFDIFSNGGVRVTDVVDNDILNIHRGKQGGGYDAE